MESCFRASSRPSYCCQSTDTTVIIFFSGLRTRITPRDSHSRRLQNVLRPGRVDFSYSHFSVFLACQTGDWRGILPQSWPKAMTTAARALIPPLFIYFRGLRTLVTTWEELRNHFQQVSRPGRVDFSNLCFSVFLAC